MTPANPILKAKQALVAIPAAGLVFGVAANWLAPGTSGVIWSAATIPVILVLLAEIVVSLRRGEVGLDIIALLSMAGAVILGEPLAANVVALMYSGGEFLEAFAARRARREMTNLLDRAPKSALRDRDGDLKEVAIDELKPGDRVLVRRGELVPADGAVDDALAVLDQAALTGEALPVRVLSGEAVMSGAANAGEAFHLTVSRPAAESTYAGIVRLVEAAARAKAPMVRLADRYALAFLFGSLAIAGAAWLGSGDPQRWLAVMVVATPCPLILAVPVAIIAGVSRAARSGVLVKGGGALEALASVRTLVIDKTGTLTRGHATIARIISLDGRSADEILMLAASLDQASSHVIATALVKAARERTLQLMMPADVHEVSGSGLSGTVNGHHVAVGGADFVNGHVTGNRPIATTDRGDGEVLIAVSVDGTFSGVIVMADEVRNDAAAGIAAFRARGVKHIILASGDSQAVTEGIAARLGIDTAFSGMKPADKVEVVVRARAAGPVLMVGDGVNDAPALAAADASVAIGAASASAAAEAADAVLLVDNIARIADAVGIAQRSRRIALESVTVGLGLSLGGMIVAAFGYLPPVAGAIFQEVVDVAVILNALRALGGGTSRVR